MIDGKRYEVTWMVFDVLGPDNTTTQIKAWGIVWRAGLGSTRSPKMFASKDDAEEWATFALPVIGSMR